MALNFLSNLEDFQLLFLHIAFFFFLYFVLSSTGHLWRTLIIHIQLFESIQSSLILSPISGTKVQTQGLMNAKGALYTEPHLQSLQTFCLLYENSFSILLWVVFLVCSCSLTFYSAMPSFQLTQSSLSFTSDILLCFSSTEVLFRYFVFPVPWLNTWKYRT